ncbi:MAG: adenylate kinase family protein [Halobacteriales archaeon]|nr:adenylate kinase family protein [Halobacteriales archaeon]
MIAALTGTPGTGKTSVGRALRALGFDVLDLGELIERKQLWEEMDEERGSKVVDPRALSQFLQGAVREARGKGRDLVLEGHLSHLVKGVEVAVVLRCEPGELARRMQERGWSAMKVEENRVAEAVDVVLVEAVDHNPMVLEVDTTGRAAEDVAREVAALLREPSAEAWERHKPGKTDWSAAL